MTDNTAKDGRPEVSVLTRAEVPNDPRLPSMISYDVVCRFRCGSFHTPDVRSAVTWADEHEFSEGHKLAREEYLSSAAVYTEDAPKTETVHLPDAPLETSSGWYGHSKQQDLPWGPDVRP